MASYAAVLSLFHTLNNLNIHPRPPISLDSEQLQSLAQNLTFFQDFLERYPTQEDYDLESRITAAAYAAEDVIENQIIDQIDHTRSTSHRCINININSADLYGGLARVIEDMDWIKREVMEIIQDKIMRPHHHLHLHTNSSRVPASTWQSSAMPVFDDAIITDVLDKLIGQQSCLQIISIVGMGGIDYEEDEEDSEEGDQDVSDSYVEDEEDEEEGDQVVTEDEEEGNPAASAILSQLRIQVRMQENRRKEIKLYLIRKQKKKKMMRKEIKMSLIRNVEDEEEGDQVL